MVLLGRAANFPASGLCKDAVLVADDGRVQCHALVLAAAATSKFRPLLALAFQVEEDEVRIVLSGFHFEEVTELVNFLYGEVAILSAASVRKWSKMFNFQPFAKNDVVQDVQVIEKPKEKEELIDEMSKNKLEKVWRNWH